MKVGLLRFMIAFLTVASSAYGTTHQTGPLANPIAWTLSRPFLNPIPSGGSDTISYQITNQLPWAFNYPLIIKKTASPQNEFSYVYCAR